MTTGFFALGPVQVGNVAGVVLGPVVANTRVVLTRAVVTNESNAIATLTLWLVRAGDTRTNANIIVGAAAAGQNMPAGPAEPYVVNALASLVLEPGDSIHALSATNNVLNFVASGWTSS